MEIEYSLKPEDFQAFARYHQKIRSLRTQPSLADIIGVLIIVIVIILGMGLLLPAFLFQDDRLLACWMGLSVGFCGAQFIRWWWQGRVNRSSLKAHCDDPRSEWAVRGIRVVLSPNQVHTIARGYTSVYEWPRIWHIGETDKHVFLCTTRNAALLIPRRAFRNNQHFEEFIALARQYQQDRRQQAPKPTGIVTGLPPQSDAFSLPDAP